MGTLPVIFNSWAGRPCYGVVRRRTTKGASGDARPTRRPEFVTVCRPHPVDCDFCFMIAGIMLPYSSPKKGDDVLETDDVGTFDG